MNDFFGHVKKVVKQRKEERYVANRQWIVDNLDPGTYKLLDNIKSVLIRVTPERSVIYYLTQNKWKYDKRIITGTPRDCLQWIDKEKRKASSDV